MMNLLPSLVPFIFLTGNNAGDNSCKKPASSHSRDKCWKTHVKSVKSYPGKVDESIEVEFDKRICCMLSNLCPWGK